jgi:large subunit ribosomal protein L3
MATNKPRPMNGIIGKKVGMTSIFDDAGRNVACTVIEAGPCVITQVKTDDTDTYNAIQLAYGEKTEKNVSQQLVGHFKAAGTTPKAEVVEFRNMVTDKALGDTVTIDDLFAEGDILAAVGTSKGKGFQGVVKRHNFKGVNDATHGQHNRQRAPGSIGAASYPAKVFKGMRMGGRDGGGRVTIKGLKVLRVFPERNLILVKGAIPGPKGGTIILHN